MASTAASQNLALAAAHKVSSLAEAEPAVAETAEPKPGPAPSAAFGLRQPRRIPELDGLRGVAILLVLFCHYVSSVVNLPIHTFGSRLVILLNLTWSGVDLFFVLSGFLIGGILLEVRDSPRYFRTFYGRRVFRIVPIYALMLMFYWVSKAVARSGPAIAWLFDKPLPWIAYATFTQNIGMAWVHFFGAMPLAITWSLAVEEQFLSHLAPGHLSLTRALASAPPSSRDPRRSIT